MQWYGALLALIQEILKTCNAVIQLVIFFIKVSYILALYVFHHGAVSLKYQKISNKATFLISWFRNPIDEKKCVNVKYHQQNQREGLNVSGEIFRLSCSLDD